VGTIETPACPAVALIYDPVYLEHDTGDHPENAARLRAAWGLLQREGILDHLTILAPYAAEREQIALVHQASYVHAVEQMAEAGGGQLDWDTVISPGSFRAARYAAGGALRAVDAVMANEAKAAFALVRPPGHHALPQRGMGFCLFNNVAIAARYGQRRHGLERILIVDFDAHHGNGTQVAFYSDPGVLYFSTHQYPFYPGSGHWEETGEGRGRGYTVNVPLPSGTGDEGFRQAYEEVLVPLARRFAPQLILASAGYDGHWADPLTMMSLSVKGFAWMAGALDSLAREHCPKKLVLVLEGGYNLEALSWSIAATLRALSGERGFRDPLGRRESSTDASEAIARAKRVHGLA